MFTNQLNPIQHKNQVDDVIHPTDITEYAFDYHDARHFINIITKIEAILKRQIISIDQSGAVAVISDMNQ